MLKQSRITFVDSEKLLSVVLVSVVFEEHRFSFTIKQRCRLNHSVFASLSEWDEGKSFPGNLGFDSLSLMVESFLPRQPRFLIRHVVNVVGSLYGDSYGFYNVLKLSFMGTVKQ